MPRKCTVCGKEEVLFGVNQVCQECFDKAMEESHKGEYSWLFKALLDITKAQAAVYLQLRNLTEAVGGGKYEGNSI